jgi:hypothetical protein
MDYFGNNMMRFSILKFGNYVFTFFLFQITFARWIVLGKYETFYYPNPNINPLTL